MLKLASDRGQQLQLEQLGNVEGIHSPSLHVQLLNKSGGPIGSVFIDRAIYKITTERLSKVKDELTQSPEHIAWKMLSGPFQRLKCAYGTEATKTPTLSLEVPCLKVPGADLPTAGIYSGQMRLQWCVSLHVVW